jgi:hypothetical protein
MMKIVRRGFEIARRGVEPSYSMQIRLKELNYRITVAMLAPSAQKSPIIAQVMWNNGLRDGNFEAYLIDRFKLAFENVQVTDMGTFVRLQTTSVDRNTFHEQVERFQQQLLNRVSSPAKIHPNLTPMARSASAEVREAAHLMIGLLRRHLVSSTEADLDKILSRAHTRLIRQLTERELRFFDYDIFGEVLTFEKDALMQSIAQKASGHVDPRDLDYVAIHEEIRRKFIQIARKQVQALRVRATPYLDSLNNYIRVLILNGEKIRLRKDKEPNLPFNEEGFLSFARTWRNRAVGLNDAQEIRQALAAIHISNRDGMNKAWKKNRRWLLAPELRLATTEDKLGIFFMDEAWTGLYWSDQELERLVKFLESDQQDFGQNEPANTAQTSGLLSVQASVVNPGNGGTDSSSFIDLGSGVPRSFEHQPRRLNSGRGNRTERFDYDTPEFD